MTDKHIKDKFRYADGTNEQDNYENFINSFDVDDEVYYRGKHYIKFINEQLKAKEQECEKWKSYYKLYRIETGIVKKVQGVINSNQKYGIEFTEDDIICKDERLSYLEVHEQVKLIIDEQAKELEQLKSENEILKEKLVISSNSDKKTLKIIQTLAEIKEIAETISLPMGTGKSCNRVILAKQILQKISEVI